MTSCFQGKTRSPAFQPYDEGLSFPFFCFSLHMQNQLGSSGSFSARRLDAPTTQSIFRAHRTPPQSLPASVLGEERPWLVRDPLAWDPSRQPSSCPPRTSPVLPSGWPKANVDGPAGVLPGEVQTVLLSPGLKKTGWSGTWSWPGSDSAESCLEGAVHTSAPALRFQGGTHVPRMESVTPPSLREDGRPLPPPRSPTLSQFPPLGHWSLQAPWGRCSFLDPDPPTHSLCPSRHRSWSKSVRLWKGILRTPCS